MQNQILFVIVLRPEGVKCELLRSLSSKKPETTEFLYSHIAQYQTDFVLRGVSCNLRYRT